MSTFSKHSEKFNFLSSAGPNFSRPPLTRMDPQGRAPKLPFPLTASPVKAHHPHGRVFEGTRCGQFGNPLWAVWESAVGSLGESTFGDPLWAEASRVSVQNVSKMWLPRVPDGFLLFFAPRALYSKKKLQKGVPRGGLCCFGSLFV